MDYSAYTFTGDRKFEEKSVNPGDAGAIKDKKAGKARLAKNRERISTYQEALYAEGKQALLVIFQAMDAGGKDGTIKHVLTGINPQGVHVASFKQPSALALSHDYLWRIHRETPARGMIGVFNRSHYEDVLAGKVLDLPKGQALPERALEDIWQRRYRQIRDFERHLYENGTTVIKFFLHVSREEQTKRFLARLDDPSKLWKFSPGDVETSGHWDQYMDAYRDAIRETAAPHAPWYVIPADHKWYTRAMVSEIILDTLRAMDPEYPQVEREHLRQMADYRQRLSRGE